jgi:hypothetical protein
VAQTCFFLASPAYGSMLASRIQTKVRYVLGYLKESHLTERLDHLLPHMGYYDIIVCLSLGVLFHSPLRQFVLTTVPRLLSITSRRCTIRGSTGAKSW